MGAVAVGPERMGTAGIRTVVERRAVRSVYQPIVDLASGAVVAYEALARGPQGSPLESPAALFAAAAEDGCASELDWVCQGAALAGALQAGLADDTALFVNVEPSLLGLAPPADVAGTVDDARRRLRVVLEITERALWHRPADLLALIADAREHYWGVALDDVGANPASLALLPFLRPDVVKLDMAVVQDRPTPELGRVAAAVMAYAEDSGALILAEGIETDAHLERAVTLGATLGQGWRFGAPAPLAGERVAQPAPLALRSLRTEPPLDTPYDTVVAAGRPTRVGRKSVLLSISHAMEAAAREDHGAPVVVSTFQTADRFTPDTARRYRRLADHCSLVAALAVGLGAEPAAGVRGAAIAPGDVLADEWSVVVIGPLFAGALVARDLGDTGPDEDRRFSFTLTHDRRLVTRAAESLLRRILG